MLSLYRLDAKVDTGAYTSSLHCHRVRFANEEGEDVVYFYVLDPKHPEFENRPYKSRVHKIKRIKSSNGQVEKRIIIKQRTVFAGKKRVIELSLSNRSEMRYPVLLGRKFITGRFIVDVSKKYLTEGI